MKDVFQRVQDAFMELGITLSAFDFEHELTRNELEEINFSLHETYKVFNEGLCETAYMCTKCRKNEQQLYNLLDIMKDCVKKGKMDAVAEVALVEFTYMIPQVLSELRMVYLQSLKNRQV